MGIKTRSLDRHLPAVATLLVVGWVAAVCLSIGQAPAAANHRGPKRLVNAALGGKTETRVLEERSEPVAVDVRSSEPPPAPQADDAKATDDRRKEPPTRDAEPKRDLGHVLPVNPKLVSDAELREPHHDYPALDLGLDPGTRLLAVTSGRVRDTTKWGACGKGVILEGDDRFTYTYCHGSKLLVGRGRRVVEGQGVMRSGNTGDSTGPHLHLQMRRPNGDLVCPQDLLPAWEKGIPKSPWEAGRRGCHTGGHKHDHSRNKKKR